MTGPSLELSQGFERVMAEAVLQHERAIRDAQAWNLRWPGRPQWNIAADSRALRLAERIVTLARARRWIPGSLVEKYQQAAAESTAARQEFLTESQRRIEHGDPRRH